MPIYEFLCLTCGNEFERLQSFTETKTPTCPNCRSENVQRQLSPPAIHFKGSGWYITDSKNGAKNGRADKEPTAKADEAKSPSTESNNGETAPAAATTSGASEKKSAAESDAPVKSANSSTTNKAKAQ